MKGRKTKPTVLKLIAGNPGKRPLNKQEPKVEIINGEIKPPEHIQGPALEEWNAQIGYLLQNPYLGVNELSILADYCFLHGKFVLEAKLGGTPNSALVAQIRGLRADLGIGPTVRSKVKSEKPQGPANPWEVLK